ncbi:MAG: chemotaxis protein CheC [Clostridiales bacterium]|jgi:chemotaxis protein CheC|nr:chemotaxis protein CheC [Clostridiales bacterium]
MPDNIDAMNAMQLDVLREIGNIGSSSAATALSKIVDKRISLSLPQVKILKFNEITQIVGGEEALVVGIMQPMHGDLAGNIMFLLRLEEAHDLAQILIHRMLNVSRQRTLPLEQFDDMEISALREVGNIMISSYLSAISSMTGLRIVTEVPELALDMAGAILSVLTIEFGKIGDSVLYIDSEFSQDNIKVGGDFFLVPDVASYATLLRALGVGQ